MPTKVGTLLLHRLLSPCTPPHAQLGPSYLIGEASLAAAESKIWDSDTLGGGHTLKRLGDRLGNGVGAAGAKGEHPFSNSRWLE